jgi:hypothetical protein
MMQHACQRTEAGCGCCDAATALERAAGAATTPLRSRELRVLRSGHRTGAGCGCCDVATALERAAGGATRPPHWCGLRRGHRTGAGCGWSDAAAVLEQAAAAATGPLHWSGLWVLRRGHRTGAGCGWCDTAAKLRSAALTTVMCWQTWPWRRPALDERAIDRWQRPMLPPEPILQRWLGTGLGAQRPLEPVQETTAKRPMRR